jgi:hypothetical protein
LAAFEPRGASGRSFARPGPDACVSGALEIARDTGAMTTAREFTIRLADLLRREQAAMADFLVALADFDRRRLWLELGHANLFSFLHRELGLSKGAAHYRKVAAELVWKFPEIVEPLRDGRLCVTSVVELAKVLSPENRTEVLPRFFHRSKREAAEVAAALRPHEAPPHRAVVTALRLSAADATAQRAGVGSVAPAGASEATAPPCIAAVVETLSQSVQPVEHPDANSPSSEAATSSQPRESREVGEPLYPGVRRGDSHVVTEPLTAELRRLHVTVSRRFLAKLEAARAALSHSRPGATAEAILETGLDLVLAEHAKRKGVVAKPRKAPPPAKTDRTPAHVRRAVWTRDGGRCQWPIDGGGICGSTLRVELDHVVPRARGGPSTVDNGRLLCAVHNQHAARLAFGDRWIDRFTRKTPVREPAASGAG